MRDRMANVAGAVALHRDALMRLKVEARLLAGLSCKEVAARSHLETELVQDYHDIFFDVKDRLGCISWIMQHIAASESQPRDHLRRTLYRHAFQGGPAVCEYWIDHLDRFGDEHDLSTAQGRAAEGLELCVLGEQLWDDPSSLRALVHLLDLARPAVPLPNTIEGMVSRRVGQVFLSRLAGEADAASPVKAAPSGKDRVVA
ncbi:hypothetical protein [Aporhodopirellula aestuarii]|uniref:hypothetical protein n=1 Tax=Aporhodopirellula aestuarii TaxID=2950107 RepID=UPI002033E7E0|nr:hypothetical protein [Aporhodopirellula aestuarii]